eukprot:1839334-Amphidinium_carterae.2
MARRLRPQAARTWSGEDVTLFSPRAHDKLLFGHWRRLRDCGFPILGVLLQRMSMPFSDRRQRDAFDRLLAQCRGDRAQSQDNVAEEPPQDKVGPIDEVPADVSCVHAAV